MDFSLIKEHPYATGGIILVGGILFLVIRSKGSAGSSSSSSPDAATMQYNLQQDQLQNAANATALAGQVEEMKIASELQAQQTTEQTNLAQTALTQQTQGQVALAAIQAGVQEEQDVTGASLQVTNEMLSNQAQTQQFAEQWLQSGGPNGQGGLHGTDSSTRTALLVALGDIMNPAATAQITTAQENQQMQGEVSSNNMFASIMNGLFNAGSKVATAAVA